MPLELKTCMRLKIYETFHKITSIDLVTQKDFTSECIDLPCLKPLSNST